MRDIRSFWLYSLLSTAPVTMACTGSISGDRDPGTPGSSAEPMTNGPGSVSGPRPGETPGQTGGTSVGTGTGAPRPSPTMAESAGPLPLRRLSKIEYDNTIRDLLGDASRPGAQLPADAWGPSGFAEAADISEVEARRFAEAAEQVATTAIKDLRRLMGCDPAGGEESCLRQWLGTFGKRAFRRPVAAAESTALEALYKELRTRNDVAGSVSLVLQAILQSPSFLYRREVIEGPATREGNLVKLGAYELASRLSYFLWRSMPDDALFAAAEGGKLRTAEDVAAQARRMLMDPKARETLADFHLQWARIDFRDVEKDTTAYPGWNAALQAAMVAEARAVAENLVTKGDGKLTTLLTSPRSHVNAALAKVYGVSNVAGAELREVALEPTQRAGFFTTGAFLAAHGAEAGSHPIRRGKVIWENVVCGAIPPVPMNVPPPKPASPGVSTRERFAEHSTNPCASACHELFDPPGFAFEHYDGIGQWRTMDGGKPVDASGALLLPMAGRKEFRNAVEMMQVLAASEDVHRCLTTQWTRYALGRHDTAADLGSLGRAYEAFKTAGFDVRELLLSLVQSKTFIFRQPAAGEVL